MKPVNYQNYSRQVWQARAVGLFALVWLTGCATDPVTGKSAYNLYTLDDDIKMGTQAMGQNVA